MVHRRKTARYLAWLSTPGFALILLRGDYPALLGIGILWIPYGYYAVGDQLGWFDE